MTAFAGRHVLAELHGVDAALLDDEPALRRAVTDSLAAAGAQVLQVVTHRFRPQGVTVLALLAESHASLHSYPELGAAFVDVFTCGERADPEHAVALLATALGAPHVQTRGVERGPGRQVVEPMADGLSRTWQLDAVVWEGRTAYQHVLVGRTAQGVSLFCDDERQSTQESQLVYHEALLLPALLLADRVERVLVIGSSEGVVSQLAVAAGAVAVDHVDIDVECVARCAEHLPYGYTLDELRRAEAGEGPVRVHYADGWAFLDGHRDYDVVVVDLPDERPEDPAAQHNRLYGTEFLRRCRDALRPGGVVAGQAGCPTLWRNATLLQSWQRFGEVFDTVVPYCSDEHEWAFLFGRPDAVADPLARMLARLGTQLSTPHYQPVSMDADALRRGTIAPHALRHAAAG